ncbi:MAG: iron transporter [Faecalicoccus sp.]|nr:iron transporter [Faecalicoccus sp.]
MNFKKLSAMLLSGAMIFGLAGCGSQSSSGADDAAAEDSSEETTAAAPGDAAGFTEYPIFEDEKLDFINLSAVYFQAVPMAPGQENFEDFDIHLEADVSALENDLGFGVGDWIPYMTVEYTVTNEAGDTVASGTMMPMSASDGPHYGANIALPDAGTYNVKFDFSFQDGTYLIHSDSETGPGGLLEDHFKDGKLSYTFEGWDYTPLEK